MNILPDSPNFNFTSVSPTPTIPLAFKFRSTLFDSNSNFVCMAS